MPRIPETYRRDFDSLEECVSFAASEPTGAVRRASREDGSRDWNGNVDFAGAVALTQTGWVDGVNRMRAIADRIYDRIAPHVSTFMNTELAVTGAGVDIGAYVSGEPECMLEFVASEVRRVRHVDIVVNVIAMGCVPADAIVNRGAAILACIEALEHAGCTVAVTAIAAAVDHDTRYDFRIALKAPGVPMDTDRLAFVLSHPAMLRRILFGCIENMPKFFAQTFTANGYGSAAEIEPDSGAAYFRQAQSNDSDESGATERALEVLHTNGLLNDDSTC